MFRQRRKVLVVGDRTGCGSSLERRLSDEGFEVMTATEEALGSMQSSWQPDVILLDADPDTAQGFAVCERTRAADPTVVIIMLSTDSSEEDEVWSLAAGADDYITQPFSIDVLLARVHAHVRGRCAAAGERRIVEAGDMWIDVPNYTLRVKGKWVDLRPREFRILAILAQSSGEPLSRQELVRRVGGQWRVKTSRTVDMQISRIRTAIETHSDYHYIHTVKRLGYRFEPVRKEVSPSGRVLKTRKHSRHVG